MSRLQEIRELAVARGLDDLLAMAWAGSNRV